MRRWQVRWRYTWLILPGQEIRRLETRRLFCLKQPIISRADFYGGRPPPRIRWKATTRTTSGGSGNRKVIRTGDLVWLAIGGEAAGRKTSTAPQKVDRTRTVFLWNGAAFSPRLIAGMRMRWKDIALCCAGCVN